MSESAKQAGDGLKSLKKYSQEELDNAYEQGKADVTQELNPPKG